MSAKYRPYLSLEQIEYILTKLAEDQDILASQIKSALQPLVFKASVGLATGSYKPRARVGVKDKLGFSTSDLDESRYLNGEMTPEEEAEYEKKLMSPTGG